MRFSLILSAFLAILVQQATAHGINLIAQYDGQVVSGKSYYSDQTPVAETYVEVVRKGEKEPLVYGKTDAQGNFRLSLTAEGELEVIIEGMEGHKVTAIANRLSASPSDLNGLQTLREDIDQLKNKLFLRDILGGIGYILGFFGLWALLKARRTQEKA